MVNAEQVWIDEAGALTPKVIRLCKRLERQRRAKGERWLNWYFNRGRVAMGGMSNREHRREMRMISWRRAI